MEDVSDGTDRVATVGEEGRLEGRLEHGEPVRREKGGRESGQTERQGLARGIADIALHGEEHSCVVGGKVPPLEALDELVPVGGIVRVESLIYSDKSHVIIHKKRKERHVLT